MKKSFFWIAVVLTCSCNPLKKAQDQFKLHPEEFADLSSKYFPCKDTSYVRDSIHFDTLYMYPFDRGMDPRFNSGVDTTISGYTIGTTDGIKIGGGIIRDTVYYPGPTRFVTKTIRHDSIIIRRDNAKEIALQNIIDERTKTVADTAAQFAGLKDSQHWWKTACLITWGILGAYLIGWLMAKIYKPKV